MFRFNDTTLEIVFCAMCGGKFDPKKEAMIDISDESDEEQYVCCNRCFREEIFGDEDYH